MAFPIYEEIPPGCVHWPVKDNRHAPHLHDGDQALVSTMDREIVWGEVYLEWFRFPLTEPIRFSAGPLPGMPTPIQESSGESRNKTVCKTT